MRPLARRNASPGCTTNYGTTGDYFVGVNDPNYGNVAGDYGSAILGGDENEACGGYSIVEGGSANIAGELSQAQGYGDVIGGGEENVILDNYGMIGAGFENNVPSGDGSFIGAGGSAPNAKYYGNTISGFASFIGAGSLNNVSGNGSFIGAGGYLFANNGAKGPGNQISGNDSFIGAGDQNTIASDDGFIGSGDYNTLTSGATYASILGGLDNTASGIYSAVLGGYGNKAGGAYGIVAGGNSNTAAGTLSFAAGYHADAVNNGSFVWSDYGSGSTPVKDTAPNQFVVRASGGTNVYSNEAATAGVKLAPGSGTWASLSDRTMKTNIAPLDETSVLAKVAALPISSWQYKTERGVRHAGPMAQDFYSAFGIGEDDRHITPIDEDGVALAAIKALHRENAGLQNRSDELAANLMAREARIDHQLSTFEAALSARERRIDALPAPRAASAFRRRNAAAPGCKKDEGTAGDYFLGVNDSVSTNAAASVGSAVLAGSGNEACDGLTAIEGGESNRLGGSGNDAAEGSAIGGGFGNVVTASEAMVGAGESNEVDGDDSFIGAGGYASNANVAGNLVQGTSSFIGAGVLNNVSGNGSFIGSGNNLFATGGGTGPASTVSGVDSSIGAGDENAVVSNDGFVGAGTQNTVTATAGYASILGGLHNNASGLYSVIFGGYGNSTAGEYGIVAGGNSDSAAGELSFAAGYHASATHNGSFVWSDYTSGSTAVKDSAANQFIVRASGGTYVYSNEAATAGVKLAAGSGTWANLSDRNAKIGIVPLEGASVLAKLSNLPISIWQYTTEPGIRHAGPMAQDFYSAFGVGEDDRHITSIDEEGIALAAIGALSREHASLENRTASISAALETQDAQTRGRLAALATGGAAIQRRLDRLDASIPRRENHATAKGRALRRPHASIGCTTNYGTAGDYFVGVSDSTYDNVAGGKDSGVLGGRKNEACDDATAIAGGYENTVGGSGDDPGSVIGAGQLNLVVGTYSMIGSGNANTVNGITSFIGAGAMAPKATSGGNAVEGNSSFVGTGTLNNVSGDGSFIGAGGYLSANTGSSVQGAQIMGYDAFIGAGDQNSIAANDGFIGSGMLNTLSSGATNASILGGLHNSASGTYAAVLGGYGNSATGSYAIVGGGNSNIAAGSLTFAAGYHASASHNGSFVWSDYSSGSSTIADTAPNQFVIRASGGTSVYSNEATTAGVRLAPGSGAWSNLSDRNAKTGIAPLDDAAILAKVSTLPVSTWEYKTERGVRHAGPMAQDFYAAFRVGEDDRHITSIDEDGVALAAIKALSRENTQLRRQCASLEAARAAFDAERERRLSRLEAASAALTRRLQAFE